jgi:chromosomal replication initiation ATPase DnaA
MARQLRLSLGRQSPPAFDDFARGPSNADAFDAVRSWPAWPGGCLALVGPKGSGKSHLAQAWAAEADALIAHPTIPDVAAMAGRPILLEDADGGIASETLFHLINLAARQGGGLLLTARTLPASWPTALPDLRSRLNALMVAQIDPPDDEVLEGALRRFFQQRNIRPSEDVYPYLLARMGRSIPAAEELVRRLDEAGDEGFKPVTRVLARQILEADLDLD